jgi:hypothetical protein
LCATAAQTPRTANPNANRPQATSRGPAKQWEYLVVSFGKTYFSEPNLEPETKTAGLSKLVSYSKLGVVSAQEALTVQWQMDTLGKFGWELIGIVGAIGGDQEMVFRRAYDPEQSKVEATLIREEGERLLAAQREVASNLAQADFVDLDAIEKAAAIAQTRQKEEARLKTAIESLNNPAIVEVKVVSSATSPDGSALTAEVTVDGTAQLLKEGNKYRSSEAQALAKQVATAIYRAAGLSSRYESDSYLSYALGEVKINALVRISYQGKQKIVATANAGGKWPDH